MADFEVQLQGLEELRAKLRKLPEAVGNRAMRRALRRGANVIRDAARAGAQRVDDPGSRENIAKNIVTQSVSRRRESYYGGPTMRVGVLGGAKQYKSNKLNDRKRRSGSTYSTGGTSANPGGDTFYWRYLEFGTSRIGARPFMRPALAQAGERTVATVVSAMTIEADKELAKLGVK